MTTVGSRNVHKLVDSAIGQRRVEPRAGPFDGGVPSA